jgi:hypothetical protein
MNQCTNALDRAINNRIATATFVDLDVFLEVLLDENVKASVGAKGLLSKVVNQVFANKCNRSVGDTINGYRFSDLISDCLLALCCNPEYTRETNYPSYALVRTTLETAHREFMNSTVLPLNLYVRDTYR